MTVISIKNLSFRYDKQNDDILNHVNFIISENSKIGLIGKNGSGKSTLLSLITKSISPDSGKVDYTNCKSVGYLPQSLSSLSMDVSAYLWGSRPDLQILKKIIENSMDGTSEQLNAYHDFFESGGYDFELELLKLAERFKLKVISNKMLNKYSGGEQTKLALMRLLLQSHDLLVFDEPTNHLDLSSKLWLKSFLQDIKIPFLLISHDTFILNECTNETIEISKGNVHHYGGNYQFYKQKKEQDYNGQLSQYEKYQQKQKSLLKQAQVRKQEALQMEGFKKSRSVKKNGAICKRDEGSGSASVNIQKKMRSAMVLEKRVSRMRDDDGVKKPFQEKRRKPMFSNKQDFNVQQVLSVVNLEVKIDQRHLFGGLSFDVYSKEKLAIVGPNGVGKSTLINILYDSFEKEHSQIKFSPQAKIMYHKQSLDNLDPNLTVFNQFPSDIHDSKVGNILGALELSTELFHQRVGELSFGEQSKVSLACCILQEGNFLIMDEPTNHLEIKAQANLINAIDQFSGVVMFVSHDINFIKQVATKVLDLSNLLVFESVDQWIENTPI